MAGKESYGITEQMQGESYTDFFPEPAAGRNSIFVGAARKARPSHTLSVERIPVTCDER